MADIRSNPLTQLNLQSQTNTFRLEDLPWDLQVDPKKLWAPVEMNPLNHLPSFALYTKEQKKAANQYFALGICEQFIWFESDLLCRVLCKILSFDLDPDLREALKNFENEEKKHTEMFWRLLQKADSQRYKKRKFSFFNINSVHGFLVKLVLRLPRLFLAWVWLAILFEERTLDYSRQYGAASSDLDSLFCQCHRFHMKDEARHLQMDQFLLKKFYNDEGSGKKKLAVKMFYFVMRSYVSPKRTARRIISALSLKFPETKNIAIQLEKELPLLRTSKTFHQVAFSEKSLGRTFRIMAKYPEMNSLWPLFVFEKKENYVSNGGVKKSDQSSIDADGPPAFL